MRPKLIGNGNLIIKYLGRGNGLHPNVKIKNLLTIAISFKKRLINAYFTRLSPLNRKHIFFFLIIKSEAHYLSLFSHIYIDHRIYGAEYNNLEINFVVQRFPPS